MALTKIKKDEKLLFVTKYSKALGDYICGKVQEGVSVRALCKTHRENGMIAEKTIYRWKKAYPEFKKNLDDAYRDLIFMQMDELNELSKELMDIAKKMGEATKEEVAACRLYSDGIRQRMDALKFSLAKLAPKLVPELQDQANVQIAIPTINIIRYTTDTQNKLP